MKTLSGFQSKKRHGEKIVVVTAYDVVSARIAKASGVDALLVGDSVGMVMLGYETTLPVTLGEMLHHCRAVSRAGTGLPLIVDMPYGSFHDTPAAAARRAVRLVKHGGASAVKLEGGRRRAAMIDAILAAEIPVMGHLGLTPQSIHRFGGYKVQGRGPGAGDLLLDEAQFLEEAGCFAIVLECVPANLAARITGALNIPTIGIGAGRACDGQVLVFHDILGLGEGAAPTFVKRYAELGAAATAALRRFAAEVRCGDFPGDSHAYSDEPAGAPEGSATPGQMPGSSGRTEG